MTRDTIYERIWGYEFETSSKSLDVYIGYLRRKTEADGEPRLIRTVRGVGYTLRDGMSLRLRLTLVVAVTFALVVVGCTYAAHVSASRQLRSETDAFLAAALDPLHARAARASSRSGGQDADDDGGRRRAPRSPTPTPSPSSSTRNGKRRRRTITGQPALPVDAHDRALAQHGGQPRFRNVTRRRRPVPDAHGRAARAAAPSQIARSIDADNNVLVVARHAPAAHRARRHARRRVARVAHRPPHRAADRATSPTPRPTSRRPRTSTTRSTSSRRDEIGRLASSFNSMLDALRTSREQQRRLVLDASHELRTPLTALRTNIDLLRRARSFDEAQRDELLGATDVELRELTDLVSELVELATDTRTEEAGRSRSTSASSSSGS